MPTDHTAPRQLIRAIAFNTAWLLTMPAALPAAAGDTAPNALLAIDQNRSTVVDRIVGQWGDTLAAATAGLTKDQFHTLLTGLRSDELLAASLAGSLEGLRNVVANALTASAPVATALTPKGAGRSH